MLGKCLPLNHTPKPPHFKSEFFVFAPVIEDGKYGLNKMKLKKIIQNSKSYRSVKK